MGGGTLLWFELASVAQLDGGFRISEAANKIMSVLSQQGALLLFPGPYGRLGGLPSYLCNLFFIFSCRDQSSSTPPSVLPRNSVTKNKMPVELSQTDENLRTQLISTSQFLLKAL